MALDALAGSVCSNQVAEAYHQTTIATQFAHAQDEAEQGGMVFAEGVGPRDAHILQCCAGASGGAVIDASGHLSGLMTSNARHSGTGTTIPTLNFSIPATLLRPLLDISDKKIVMQSDLDELDVISPALQHLWGRPINQQARTQV